MPKLSRNIIQIISRNSNWRPESVEKELETKVYSQNRDWQKFIYYLLIALGVSFTVSGIIFFFAFNWDAMPKFFKFGLIEFLIIACVVVILKFNFEITVKKIILTGAALLVGALFAVFGQVYQTGADAYGLFLIWSVFILIWTIVGNFAPLWFVFMVLLNTTISLYSVQVAHWNEKMLSVVVFLVNALFVVIVEILSHLKKIKRPAWLLNLVALNAIVYISIGLIWVIFAREAAYSGSIICLSVGIPGLLFGAFYGYRSRNLFYVSAVGLSFLVIIACWLFKLMMDMGTGVLIFTGLYAILATIGLVKVITHLNREWHEME